jgi:hypothetical protein
MVSQAEFARQQGWSRSYVTQLKKEGRLVMSDDGKKVLPQESLAKIKATEDPNREDVKQRHAAEREHAGEVEDKTGDKIGSSYQAARAVKERFNALSAKLAYEKEAGTVVEAEAVKKAGFELGTHIRTALENMPDLLAPELAPISDPARVHAVLVEYFEALLTDVSRQIANIAEVK